MDNKILIGCDPELFVYDAQGRPVSAFDLIEGSKVCPKPVPNGAIQRDGVAAEFNIKPADNVNDFIYRIRSVRSSLLEEIHKTDRGYVLKANPTIKFTRKQWNSISEDAKMLGCEPDFSAYTPTKPNERPITDKFMRTGAGHIHISWGETVNDFMAPLYRTKVASLIWHLDKHLYKESLKWDKDKERQELYGQAGAFRPKPYGVEYRTLSNAWLNSEDTMKFVFNTAKACTMNWLNGTKVKDYDLPAYRM